MKTKNIKKFLGKEEEEKVVVSVKELVENINKVLITEDKKLVLMD